MTAPLLSGISGPHTTGDQPPFVLDSYTWTRIPEPLVVLAVALLGVALLLAWAIRKRRGRAQAIEDTLTQLESEIHELRQSAERARRRS